MQDFSSNVQLSIFSKSVFSLVFIRGINKYFRIVEMERSSIFAVTYINVANISEFDIFDIRFYVCKVSYIHLNDSCNIHSSNKNVQDDIRHCQLKPKTTNLNKIF